MADNKDRERALAIGRELWRCGNTSPENIADALLEFAAEQVERFGVGTHVPTLAASRAHELRAQKLGRQ